MAHAATPYENKALDVVRSWLSLDKYGLLVAFVLMMLGFSVLQLLGGAFPSFRSTYEKRDMLALNTKQR